MTKKGNEFYLKRIERRNWNKWKEIKRIML